MLCRDRGSAMRALEIDEEEATRTCCEEEEIVDLIRNFDGDKKGSRRKRAAMKCKPSILASLADRIQQQWKTQWRLALSLCGVVGFLFFLPWSSTGEGEEAVAENNNPTQPSSIDQHGPIIKYGCPAQQRTAENIATSIKEHEEWYVSVSQRIAASNLTDYFQSFRNTEYDNWGHSYEEVKAGMLKWKSENFNDLKSGDFIYESACGIGLNLFMTLEILQETLGVSDLVVYGNEYIPLSVQIAQNIANGTKDHPKSFLPARGQYGSICTADSTQLDDFVPADAFDLVYTGYISPLFNPLSLNGTSTDDNFAQYAAFCEGKTEGDVELAERAQNHQNDWYAKWVGQMIRIAKPGKPVIVEQISYPLCDAMFDWGGVKPSFWTAAIEKYGWDVDAASLVVDNDSIFRRRYHVFMRKNS